MKKILLTGATGYVGNHLLRVLEHQNYHVRCLVRSKRAHLKDQVVGNVLDKTSLLPAFAGIETAFYLIHSMGDEGDFAEQDRIAARNFAEAANEAGVKRIIYLGGLGADEENLSDHLSSRHEVGDILRRYASQVVILELRASIVIGAGSLSYEMVRALCERLPFMITPKWVWEKTQPIAIDDLLNYLLEAIEIPLKENKIIEIGGTDQVTYADLMKEYSTQRGLRRLMVPVPVLTPYLSSLWLGLVTPLYSKVGRKLIESACHETIVRSDEANRLFTVKPMGVKEAISRALSEESAKWALLNWPEYFFSKGEIPDNGTYQIGGRIIDIKSIEVPISKIRAFEIVQQIGGKTGWYFGNSLWKLRGWIDQLIGGVGLRRGRTDPHHLKKGDTLDFWRVENVSAGEWIKLHAEMKLPGEAWLEFRITGDDTHSQIHQIALYDAKGLSGLLYWYVLLPFHRLIFNGMIRGIGKRAIAGEHKEGVEFFARRHQLSVSNNEAFAWHKRQGAFLRLTPPWQKIEIVEQKGTIHDGDYLIFKMKMGFISIIWKAVHERYIENRQFCDNQLQGPFSYWNHEHKFQPINERSSYLNDQLSYKLPGGIVGKWLLGHHTHIQLNRLFRFRHKRTEQDLSYHHKHTGVPPMKILIAGSTGLIGKQLTAFLTTGGHQVVPLTREPDQKGIYWSPKKGKLDPEMIEGFDAIINLAGENISSGRWTEKKKQRIRDSRVLTTRTLAEAIAKLKNPPKVWINGSAIGYYGDGNDKIFDESSESGKSFLSIVCDEWEAATKPAVEAGVRVVLLRTGIVLTPTGGALERMLTPFQLGIGGVLGSGRQYMSWISIEDEIRIIDFCLRNDKISGPVNAVSPQSVTNRSFTKALGRVLRRPTLLPLPKFLVKIAFGEMGQELLLSSTRVVPKKLEMNGYEFLHPNLEEALKELLGKD